MTTGIDVFDTTIQKTNLWIKAMMDGLKWEDRHKSFQAMRVVLRALRDRLTVEEAAQLGSQLPVLIRGFYYESWNPAHKPEKMRDRQEFLDRIHREFTTDATADPEAMTRAVFKLLSDRISEGEIEDITQMMPPELRDLWPEEARS